MSAKDYDWRTDQAEIAGEYWIHNVHMDKGLEDNSHTPSQSNKAVATVL